MPFDGIGEFSDPMLNTPGSILDHLDQLFCQLAAACHGGRRQSGAQPQQFSVPNLESFAVTPFTGSSVMRFTPVST